LTDPSGTRAESPAISAEEHARLSDMSLEAWGIEDEPKPKPKPAPTPKQKEPDRSGDGPITAESRASKEGRARIKAAAQAKAGRDYDTLRQVETSVRDGMNRGAVWLGVASAPLLGAMFVAEFGVAGVWALVKSTLEADSVASGFPMSVGVVGGVVAKASGVADDAAGLVDDAVGLVDDAVGLSDDAARLADDAAGAGVDPSDINFSQPTISQNFGKGGTIDDTIGQLRRGDITPADIPAIRVVEWNGQLVTLDNRRLATFQAAGIKNVPVERVSLADPAIAKEFAKKFNPVNGGRNVVVTPNAAGRKEAERVLRQHGKIR